MAVNKVIYGGKTLIDLTGELWVVDNVIKINTHAVSFNSGGWCWGFVAYVLA